MLSHSYAILYTVCIICSTVLSIFPKCTPYIKHQHQPILILVKKSVNYILYLPFWLTHIQYRTTVTEKLKSALKASNRSSWAGNDEEQSCHSGCEVPVVDVMVRMCTLLVVQCSEEKENILYSWYQHMCKIVS